MKLLITSDLHLRDKAPISRIDPDWAAAQVKMLEEIVDIASGEDVDAILIAGDIFHKPKVSPYYETAFIQIMSESVSANVYIMPGQHDLPGHSMSNVSESSFGVLWSHAHIVDNGILPMDHFCSWETFQDRKIIEGTISNMICVHRLVTSDTDLLPAKDAITASELLDLFPDHQIIIAGDYHHGHELITGNRSKDAGRCVIVPGCTNRQAADFKDYKPSVVILEYDGRKGNVDLSQGINVYRRELSDPLEFLETEIASQRKDRDVQLESFISYMKDNNNNAISISFEDNVREAIQNGNLDSKVTEVVEYLMDWEEEPVV